MQLFIFAKHPLYIHKQIINWNMGKIMNLGEIKGFIMYEK
jgi:hypothetical protein